MCMKCWEISGQAIQLQTCPQLQQWQQTPVNNTNQHDNEIKQLREENERINKLNQELLGRPVIKSEWEKLVAENKKLKAENIDSPKNERLAAEYAKYFWDSVASIKELYIEINSLRKEKEKLCDKLNEAVVDNGMAKVVIESLHTEVDKLKAENKQQDEIYQKFVYGDKGLVADMLRYEKEIKQLKAQLQKEKEIVKTTCTLCYGSKKACLVIDGGTKMVNCPDCTDSNSNKRLLFECDLCGRFPSEVHTDSPKEILCWNCYGATQRFEEFRKQEHPQGKPHKCPVCDGNKNIIKGYAEAPYGVHADKCHVCKGAGVMQEPAK